MFSLRDEGFSCCLDVYEGLGISKLQVTFVIKKYIKNFSLIFFQFLVIKTLDLGPDPQ
jgi:hypothetical protein